MMKLLCFVCMSVVVGSGGGGGGGGGGGVLHVCMSCWLSFSYNFYDF